MLSLVYFLVFSHFRFFLFVCFHVAILSTPLNCKVLKEKKMIPLYYVLLWLASVHNHTHTHTHTHTYTLDAAGQILGAEQIMG